MTTALDAARPAHPDPRADIRLGLISAGGAYLIWGVLPLYLAMLRFATPEEVLAVRILWTVPACALMVTLIGGWRESLAAFKARGVLRALSGSAIFIGLNWWIYVWAVANAHIIEASLAYFLAPLVAACMGVAFFGERLGRLQWAALGLAGIGVVTLALVGLRAQAGSGQGFAIWVTVALCASWSIYALIRKRAAVPAAGGLFAESVLLAPLALGGLGVIAAGGQSLATFESVGQAGLLALAGPITAAPLILFALGARRLRFSTLGLLQYVAPTMQFCIGVAFGEPFGPWHAASFALIWIGLAVFSIDTVRRDRAAP